MSHTIKGFQEDKAVLLAEEISKVTGEYTSAERVATVLQTHGVVNDFTYWRKLPTVLDAFGVDYDEIVDVLA